MLKDKNGTGGGTLVWLAFAAGLAGCDAGDPVGAGSVSRQVEPRSYQCETGKAGARVESAGVVKPVVPSCEGRLQPRPRQPQRVAPAAHEPTMAHRWWGNVTFHGEHAIGDPDGIGHITPDPLMARVTERGVRLMGMPAGLEVGSDRVAYSVPEPLAEVFDGLALANSQFDSLDAYVKDYSDGSVSIEWRSGHRPVMAATFVHGSPYVYVSVFRGELVLRTHAPEGEHKGVFYREGDDLGLWTDVAGQRNHFVVSGHDETRFSGVSERETQAASRGSHFTITWLPAGEAGPSDAMLERFLAHARQPVDEVRVDYRVDDSDQSVSVRHRYRYRGEPVTTLAGLQPLHWKNSEQALTDYRVRSARGWLHFAETDGFRYRLPYVGLLPGLPAELGSLPADELKALVRTFTERDPASWNTATDTYFAGKHYGKVAELAWLARQAGLTRDADRLLDWLKAELEDWFSVDDNESAKYFVYDERWNTLLGVHESFGSHQALNDHHFHYGYFVRAAAEICRVDPDWCADDRWGPMVELLIRDYAAGRDDERFPYLRHFDPALGFSWASGAANYERGNNNESTSEAANAYGAMVLYGLVTDQPGLVERGIYLHASTAATFWEYWNDIDGYRDKPDPAPNFPEAYEPLTTSIVWGAGHVLTTWFSDAPAHILGIQALPMNALILHLGQHPDYLRDYIERGLDDAVNGKPSGLDEDEWTDIWWGVQAMTDAGAALGDWREHRDRYTPEEGETRAHTAHWLHAWETLGRLASGSVSADYPAAVAFESSSQRTYMAYNFGDRTREVRFSDGTRLRVPPGGFEIHREPRDGR